MPIALNVVEHKHNLVGSGQLFDRAFEIHTVNQTGQRRVGAPDFAARCDALFIGVRRFDLRAGL